MSRSARVVLACILSAVLIVFALGGEPAWSHEVRPALLQITEEMNGRYSVLWKQPALGAATVHLVPHISGGLLEGPPSATASDVGFHICLWRDLDAGPRGMEGRTLQIEGLDRTITDVLLSVTLANGGVTQQIVRPESPAVILHLRGSGMAVVGYILLGIEHILTGIDHLCVVLGLMMLVGRGKTLIATITAFTVAHSLTLTATALHVIASRPAIIEVLVALSIAFIAMEVVKSFRGESSFTVRHPWLIAFIFGLLHGAAFASALAQVGLPRQAVLSSLLLFNVGVELGQLLFIAAVLGVGLLLMRLRNRIPGWAQWLPPYAIGSFAMFWTIERLGAALG